MSKGARSSRRYEPLHKGVTFRFGRIWRKMSLLELGWRVGLYIERESRDAVILSGLRNIETINSTNFTHLFWPNIGDEGFNVENTKAKSIRDPRIKLAHRCITMTITGRKETTNRVTDIKLFFLYYIYGERVVCNIPYWLAKYLKGIKDKSVIFGECLNTSLVKMGVIVELYEGDCCWPATRGVVGENEGDDEEGDREGRNEGVGGSADIYRNMSTRDWQTLEMASRFTRDAVTTTSVMASNGQSFLNSINTDAFSGPQWVNLFHINEPIFHELVREFFASFKFDASPCRNTSLVKMGVIVELYEGDCCWPATRGVVGENEGDDEEGDREGRNEGVGGSADIYRNMSTRDWQV
uniref:Retrotransposon Orf1 n=1 Tax=Tanacetum cinerariifolium TaxID=118510 RepID=A0A6L2JB83_TANCI|nr:retrotransposon Orf1 [Tanacetum cinerariifolium]